MSKYEIDDISILEELLNEDDEQKQPKKKKAEKVEKSPENHQTISSAQLTLKVKLLTKTAKLPEKANLADFGWDLFVDDFISPYPEKEDKDIEPPPHYNLHPGEIMKVKTGVAFGFPEGYGGFLEGRSSLAGKGIDVLGGIIDNGYTGEIIVCLSNTGMFSLMVEKGQKIAQLVLIPCPLVKLEQVKELGKTERGEKGFGSSDQ